jgi:hypothetical protein
MVALAAPTFLCETVPLICRENFVSTLLEIIQIRKQFQKEEQFIKRLYSM